MDPSYSVSPSLLSYSNYVGGRRGRLGGRRHRSRRGGTCPINGGRSRRSRSRLSRLRRTRRRY